MNADKDIVFTTLFKLDGGKELSVAVTKETNRYGVNLTTDIGGEPLLHWGVSGRSSDEWTMPPAGIVPQGSVNYENRAIQTPFAFIDGLHRLSIPIDAEFVPEYVLFVIKDTATGKWFNSKGKYLSVPVRQGRVLSVPVTEPLMEEVLSRIVDGEMGNHSWTLMHRYNLCYELLDRVHGSSLSLIYVWLRYSFLRQLDWQRNYNTQPRELSHAMDRLTMKLTEVYVNEPDGRELIPLCLSTLGAGGDGQRIRDEILQIMHRHHLKEVSGHFLEEWHQKLHNNTTADDVAICEAYLAFLRSDGSRSAFYDTLYSKGVTKERLELFERPIRSAPDFISHLKDALIRDFENYLKILKSVHTGTDLLRTISATYNFFGKDVQKALSFILDHKEDPGTSQLDLARTTVWVRKNIKDILNDERDLRRVREILFLDHALEDFLRIIVERQTGNQNIRELTGLLRSLLQSLAADSGKEDLRATLRHLDRVFNEYFSTPANTADGSGGQRVGLDSPDWHLHLVSIIDNLNCAIGPFIDHYYSLFHDYSLYLGQAFHADKWVMELFTEEVIRTRPVFGLSLLLKRLETALRNANLLTRWQVVSTREATGIVVHTGNLHSVQHDVYCQPTVIVADKVNGSEEIPPGAVCVITGDTVDIVSHVGVRARNSHVLFASCYDEALLERLRNMQGKWLSLKVDPSGDVVFAETGQADVPSVIPIERHTGKTGSNRFGAYALTTEEFSTATSGLKSNNLAALRGKLPDWISLPRSVSIPFGVMERVFMDPTNAGLSETYSRLTGEFASKTKTTEALPEELPKALNALKECIMALRVPGELMDQLTRALGVEGIPVPADAGIAWERIKHVWASAWNEPAFLSRRKMGIRDISMAVLIQEVVEAGYAFVLHTVNPVTSDAGELYGEVVLGLGETLVGNYPGRAFSFASRKDTLQVKPIHYPSKNVALYGGGVIFRSDTSAEDMHGYAGAGLYDSITLVPPRQIMPEYSTEPLAWDGGFRDYMARKLTELGVEIERISGSPQDIEGAISKDRFVVVQSRSQVGIH
ncbi:MAG: hypothetical protein HQK89_16955 [Nitrospirae bacterium]|nr:hypothetical protein [Nitrospirota bacterium]